MVCLFLLHLVLIFKSEDEILAGAFCVLKKDFSNLRSPMPYEHPACLKNTS